MKYSFDLKINSKNSNSHAGWKTDSLDDIAECLEIKARELRAGYIVHLPDDPPLEKPQPSEPRTYITHNPHVICDCEDCQPKPTTCEHICPECGAATIISMKLHFELNHPTKVGVPSLSQDEPPKHDTIDDPRVRTDMELKQARMLKEPTSTNWNFKHKEDCYSLSAHRVPIDCFSFDDVRKEVKKDLIEKIKKYKKEAVYESTIVLFDRLLEELDK